MDRLYDTTSFKTALSVALPYPPAAQCIQLINSSSTVHDSQLNPVKDPFNLRLKAAVHQYSYGLGLLYNNFGQIVHTPVSLVTNLQSNIQSLLSACTATVKKKAKFNASTITAYYHNICCYFIRQTVQLTANRKLEKNTNNINTLPPV